MNDMPFFHLASRHVDTICLTATTHGKVNIKRWESKPNISFGDNIESGGVIKDMIVKRELAADDNRF